MPKKTSKAIIPAVDVAVTHTAMQMVEMVHATMRTLRGPRYCAIRFGRIRPMMELAFKIDSLTKTNARSVYRYVSSISGKAYE